MNWIKANWTILAALVTMGAAWGQQQMKVQNLEQAIVQQAESAREQKNNPRAGDSIGGAIESHQGVAAYPRATAS